MTRSAFLLGVLLLGTPLAAQSVAPQRTELTADDLVMTSTDRESRVVCVGNVQLTGTNLRIVCDRLEIIADRDYDPTATLGELRGFKYLLATGNVRIVQGQREATCGRAEVLPGDDKVVLSENPVVLDRATDFIGRGEVITLLRGEQRMEIKQPRFSAPPIQDLGADASAAAPAPTTPPESN